MKVNKQKEETSLSKYIATSGYASRRKATGLIVMGAVKVNGKVITEPGHRVSEKDTILIHDKPLTSEDLVYIVLHKPTGVITTAQDEKDRATIMDLIKPSITERVFPVGRLDRNTTGVLLLTNNGELANMLMHPRYQVEKEYWVTLDRALLPTHLKRIQEGVWLSDGKVVVDSVSVNPRDHKNVRIILHSGKYRVIRRLFDQLGYKVKKLARMRYAFLTAKGLASGQWRFLTKKEISRLQLISSEKKKMTKK